MLSRRFASRGGMALHRHPTNSPNVSQSGGYVVVVHFIDEKYFNMKHASERQWIRGYAETSCGLLLDGCVFATETRRQARAPHGQVYHTTNTFTVSHSGFLSIIPQKSLSGALTGGT